METFKIRAVDGKLWVVLMALFLTACGGDGGSVTDTPTVAPPPSPPETVSENGAVLLSEENAIEVTQAVVQALGSSSSLPLGVWLADYRCRAWGRYAVAGGISQHHQNRGATCPGPAV